MKKEPNLRTEELENMNDKTSWNLKRNKFSETEGPEGEVYMKNSN